MAYKHLALPHDYKAPHAQDRDQKYEATSAQEALEPQLALPCKEGSKAYQPKEVVTRIVHSSEEKDHLFHSQSLCEIHDSHDMSGDPLSKRRQQ